MKLLIALFTLFSISFAQAETGSVESLFTPEQKNLENSEVTIPYQTRLFLQNNCYTDVYIAVQTLNSRGFWESKGYFHIYPGQSVYATNFKDSSYYLYGFTGDRRVYWQGAYRVEMLGQIVPAMWIPVQTGGSWTTLLFCR